MSDDDALERYVAEIVAAAPPQTDEQRQRLREIFRPRARRGAG